MRTERTFLMELFLDDDLPKNIKLKIKDRFQELEEHPPLKLWNPPEVFESNNAIANQSPSMQRLMQSNPDLIPKPPMPSNPAAAQALAARNALLASAGSEKPENGRRSPRKI